jgi:hypothetical protein
MIPYEQRLDADIRWALLEGSRHFEKNNSVHKSLRKVCQRLEALGVPYAVMGDLAMFFHGFRRFTEYVEILVAPAGLKEIHCRLEGVGYVSAKAGGSDLRDTENGVRIAFQVTGTFPGNGKPKPLAFPDPAETCIEIDGIPFLHLHRLIELKLASGMSGPRWLQDLADVQQLIAVLALPQQLADQLHPSVQESYRQLWQDVHDNPAEP